MKSILSELKTNPCIKLIADYLKDCPQEVYLVGGFIRDLFLGRKKANPDLDFAVSSQAVKLGRALARKLGCGFVVLDEEHGSCRVIYKEGDTYCNFDLTDFRGSTTLTTSGRDISEDLLLRDFTINSLAADLRRIQPARRIEDILIDKSSAVKDIKRKIIRVVSGDSLVDDPLRILRAFSLSAALDFKIEPGTERLIRKYKDKLCSSAFERITEELFKILNSGNAFRTFKHMDRAGVLEQIFPEIKPMRRLNQGPYHHLDVYQHSLETLKQMERLLPDLKSERDIQDYLDGVISGVRTRRALLKLAAFLHDVGKPVSKRRIKDKICFHGHEKTGRNIVRVISERLRLSADERGALDRIIFWHLRPGYLADMVRLSRKAVYRFFRDTKDEAVSVLLLSISDQRSTRGPLTRGENRRHQEQVCLDLSREFFLRGKEKVVPKLVDGFELMRHFKLPPGPHIGELLEKIKEAQNIGRIASKTEAFKLAEVVLKKKRR